MSRSSFLNLKTTIRYSGPYTTLDGKEHMAEDMELVYVDHEEVDYSAGITSSWVDAAQPDAHDGEENIICIDMQDWAEAVCEQTGGHNFVDHQWSEEPESACRICTRCGKEIDPA